MIKDKLISLKELDNLIDLIKFEQTFRVKLSIYKELKEMELKFVGELKPLAERLKRLKSIHNNIDITHDKELNTEIKNMVNKKFVGGI